MKNERMNDVLQLEELEIVEELDDAAFSVGFALGVALVAGTVILTIT